MTTNCLLVNNTKNQQNLTPISDSLLRSQTLPDNMESFSMIRPLCLCCLRSQETVKDLMSLGADNVLR